MIWRLAAHVRDPDRFDPDRVVGGGRPVRSGADTATSALDPSCRAHELDHLHVADTSFSPSIGAVNPSLTAIANALRIRTGPGRAGAA